MTVLAPERGSWKKGKGVRLLSGDNETEIPTATPEDGSVTVELHLALDRDRDGDPALRSRVLMRMGDRVLEMKCAEAIELGRSLSKCGIEGRLTNTLGQELILHSENDPDEILGMLGHAHEVHDLAAGAVGVLEEVDSLLERAAKYDLIPEAEAERLKVETRRLAKAEAVTRSKGRGRQGQDRVGPVLL